jgi:peptide/nickel transport system substrate-binding protein
VSITASDFVFNWKMQLLVGADLPASDPIGGYEDIASVKGSNNGKTVTVVFAKPYADWQSLFTNLVPAHIAKNLAGWKHDFTSARYKTLVSGGPFMVEKYISSDELVLVRNPHYWGPEAGVAQIIFKVEPSQAAILQALATGSIDMASLLPSQKVANTVVESTDLTESTQPGADLWQLNFNLADPTVANLDLREAIALAIDRHQIVSDTVGLLTPFNNVAANHLFPYAYQGSQPNDSAYEVVNLTQSIAELASAGFTVSSDGIARNAAGAPLVLTLLGPSGNSVISGVEALIQSELLEIGIEVNITNVPSAKLLGTDLPRGEYQLALAPYLMSQFLSTDAALYTNPVGPIFSEGPGGTGTEPAAVQSGVVTRDVTGYTDANVTELFADASQELSAGATNTYNQIDTAIWADLPSLPLFQMPNAFISSARVLNVSNSQGWLGPMWNAQNWKIQVSPVPTTTTTLPS